MKRQKGYSMIKLKHKFKLVSKEKNYLNKRKTKYHECKRCGATKFDTVDKLKPWILKHQVRIYPPDWKTITSPVDFGLQCERRQDV